MTKEIPLRELKHIDYGYCVTVHNAQGKTFDNTIAAISKNRLLNNQQSWLVSLSRHRVELSILSEDMKTLNTYLSNNTGKEISALELIFSSELKTIGQKSTDLNNQNAQVKKSQSQAMASM